MATKTGIKKFLEVKAKESTEKLKAERNALIDDAVNEFISQHSGYFSEIKNYIKNIGDSFDGLVGVIRKDKTGNTSNQHYDTAERKINDLSSAFTVSGIKNTFTIQSKVLIEEKYKKLITESANEYVRLIAVTQSIDAKDGIVILKNLGFDTESIEAPKQTTALITNIDAKKLFI